MHTPTQSRCDACGAAYNGCPMHKAALALLAACERLLREAPLVRGNVTGLWAYLARWESEAEAAIAAAKGE